MKLVINSGWESLNNSDGDFDGLTTHYPNEKAISIFKGSCTIEFSLILLVYFYYGTECTRVCDQFLASKQNIIKIS